jgi:surface protein
MYIDSLIIGNNVKNIDNLFKNCSKITEDISIPLHVTSCISAFENCKGITHVQSNWTKTYTNGITPTNCYSNCTGITHIDDVDIGANEYKFGLDEIPVAWGGIELSKRYTCIMKINIPTDNYTVSFPELLRDGSISWGDDVITTGVKEHIYSVAGDYIVKGKFLVSSYTSSPATCISETLIEVFQVPDDFNNLVTKNLFRNCKKLTYVNLNNWNINGYLSDLSEAFYGCTSLVKVDAYNSCFRNKDLYNLFSNCTSLTEINGVETWNVSDVTNFSSLFQKCILLETMDLSNWDIKSGAIMETMFDGCSNLTTLKFPLHVQQPSNVQSMFANTFLLTRIENCPIPSVWTGMNIHYWAYSNLNVNPIGQLITFSSVGKIKEFSAYYNQTFFKRVASETITNLANALYDYSSEGTTKSLNTYNTLSYFTDDQVAIFTNKGWTLT